jgi:hypothetical protein
MPSSTNTKRRLALNRWTDELLCRFLSFTRPQAKGLALWSIGLVLASSVSLHAVSLALASWLPFKLFTIRRRLQEWYQEAAAKKGHGAAGRGYNRSDWNPHAVAPGLLRWIIDGWPNKQLVVALDPTNFGDRFTVLNISVLYRSCAVPVNWTVVKGGEPGAWEPHWERMLADLATQVPKDWQVLVVTDRGMYSPRLFRCIETLHWHPFLRIRAQGLYRPKGSSKWLELKDLRPPSGESKAFEATVFKNEEGQLHCTLLASYEDRYEEPWLLVTDIPGDIAQASWYGLRAWIEQGYKRVKSEGWQMQRTRITDCTRLERLWLATAVATLWVLEVGGEDEVKEQRKRSSAQGGSKQVGEDVPPLPDLGRAATPKVAPEFAKEDGSKESKQPKRIHSIFSRGWNLLKNALSVGLILWGSLYPEPWPEPRTAGQPAVATSQTQSGGSGKGNQTRHSQSGCHRCNSS